jgi:NAD(P)-dependent dehydrogenase (short-subunit alcohol dehydrogenase family)
VSLAGQRVVVVGGTSGMGRATASAAAEAGAEVIAAGRRAAADHPPAPNVTHATVDVTDESSVEGLFAGLDRVDHLFVSASPGRPGPLLEQDLAAARSFVDGKLLGTWMCARYAAPLMTAGGSMTFITGVAAVRPPGNAALVTAAFAAVEALAPALALELAPVRVNVIRPGYTDSDMWSSLTDAARDDLRARVRAAMPVGRMGTPEDIAQAALFLMTSPQTTGIVLEVSGGESLVDRLAE